MKKITEKLPVKCVYFGTNKYVDNDIIKTDNKPALMLKSL